MGTCLVGGTSAVTQADIDDDSFTPSEIGEVYTVINGTIGPSAGFTASLTATPRSGDIVVGGGYIANNSTVEGNVVPIQNGPGSGGWTVTLRGYDLGMDVDPDYSVYCIAIAMS